MDIKTKNERAKGPGESPNTDLAEALLEIGRRCSALPDLDTRDADEILGYERPSKKRKQASKDGLPRRGIGM